MRTSLDHGTLAVTEVYPSEESSGQYVSLMAKVMLKGEHVYDVSWNELGADPG